MIGRLQPKMQQVAVVATVLLVFSGPTSRALFNVSALVLLLSWLLAGRLQESWTVAWRNPIARPALLLFSVILVGMLYSDAPWRDRWEHFRVYSKLPFLLLLVSMWQQASARNRAWLAYFLAMALVVGTTYLNVWLGLPWSWRDVPHGTPVDRSVLLDYIIQGIATSILVGIALDKVRDPLLLVWQRIVWLLAALLSGYSVFFILIGKTGPLALGVVLACFVFWGLPRAVRWFGLGFLVFGLVGLVALAPELSARFEKGLRQLSNTGAAIDFESVGLRWEMWQFSARMIMASPLWGHGTGAYHGLAAQHLTHCEVTCFHPHNQFLFFGVEQGLLGVGAYLYFLFAIYRVGKLQAANGSIAMMAFFAVLVVESLLNAPLWYRMESYIFYPLIALFMSNYHQQELRQYINMKVVGS